MMYESLSLQLETIARDGTLQNAEIVRTQLEQHLQTLAAELRDILAKGSCQLTTR